MSDAVIAPPAKVDPETLAIRAKPARAIRFRKGVIIGIAAMGSASLMTVAWVALKPRVFSTVAGGQELSEPNSRPSTDTLNALPTSYGDAPKLGPPLPGDLGRPILRAQERAQAGVGPAPVVARETARQQHLGLQNALQAYAAIYSETYGVEEPVADLIPAILMAFLESDRAFNQARAAAERIPK